MLIAKDFNLLNALSDIWNTHVFVTEFKNDI